MANQISKFKMQNYNVKIKNSMFSPQTGSGGKKMQNKANLKKVKSK